MTEMEKIVEYIYDIPKFTKKGGLSQTAQIMALFGNPENAFPYIHIAGTNGKGSVSAYLSSMLKACGLKTGMFTSPHLVRINERMKIDGEEIDDGDFIRIFFAVKDKIDAWIMEGGVHPTFFEFIYLMAMLWFRENKVDIAVVETGLGGRLDATNVVKAPLLTVITSIGFDHMQYLGSTLDKIAGEKAGIMKKGCPVVYDGTSDTAALDVLYGRLTELGNESIAVTDEDILGLWSNQTSLGYRLRRLDNDSELTIKLPTPARYQAVNSAVAVRSLELLYKSGRPPFHSTLWQQADEKPDFYETVCEALAHTKWAGRFELAAQNIYIDGAHNDAGIEALCESIEAGFSDKPVYLLFAVAEDKDYTGMIRRLSRLRKLEGVMVTAIENERQTSVDLVEHIFRENWHGLLVGTYNIKEALKTASKWTKGGGRLFCTGSLYLAGSLKILQEKTRHRPAGQATAHPMPKQTAKR